jgi:protocatechuate 3,4-dioxygenase beta subunit
MRRYLLAIIAVGLLVGLAVYLRPAPETEPSITTVERGPAPKLRAQGERGSGLDGQVADLSGAPIAGARVVLVWSGRDRADRAHCSEGQPLLSCPARPAAGELAAWIDTHQVERLEARTGSDGRFHFDGLAGGPVDLFATADGLSAGHDDRAFPGEPATIRLGPGRVLQGEVVDEQGNRVAARVDVLGPALLEPLRISSPDGIVEIKGAGEGPLTVLARAAGFLPVKTVVDAQGPLTVRLLRPRTLHVSVRGPSGPLDAQVEVEASHLRRGGPTREGRIDLGELYPGEVTVRASAPGLASTSRQLELQDLETSVELTLMPGAPLWVSLADGQGQPVESPTLVLDRLDEHADALRRQARTGERVTFGTVPAGDYRLRVYAKGYKPLERAVRVGTSEVDMDLTVERGPRIAGRVVDAQGRPVAGVSVAVSPLGEGATSEADGRFQLQVPSNGRYELTAHHSEWGGAMVSTDAPAENVELRLQPHAGIEATVLSGGEPVAGAVVSIAPAEGEEDNRFFTDRVTDARGHVVLRGVPAGKYFALAEHAQLRSAAPVPVTLEEGRTLPLTLELKPGASLSGTVHDEQGAAVAGARVEALLEGDRQLAQTGPDGHFEIGPLDPTGSYSVNVVHPGFTPLHRQAVRPTESPLDLTLAAGRTLTGRVLDERGQPLAAVRLNGFETQTDHGRFSHAEFAGEPEDLLVVGAAGYKEDDVTVPPGTTDLGDLVLERAPTLAGRVVDGSGAPVASAIVDCDLCVEPTLSDAQGQYSLSLPNGLRPEKVNASLSGASGSVAVPPEGAVPDVVLHGQVHVTGLVTDAQGQPMPGQMVLAFRMNPAAQNVAVTGTDGRYAVDLSVGTYRFVVGHDLTGSAIAVVAHVEGTQAQVDLGPGAGGSALLVHTGVGQGELWVVRGEVPAVVNAETLDPAYALVARFHGPDAHLPPMPAGHYTVFVAQPFGGPLLAGPARVDLPGQSEVTLPAFARGPESE